MDIDTTKQLIQGVLEGTLAKKLEKSLREALSDMKKLKCMKESKVDLEIAIIKAQMVLDVVEETRKTIVVL